MSEKVKADDVCPVKHIAFIMDGNGRWAKKRGMPREMGHRYGAEVFRKVMRHCGEIGIKAATFYVFSTENWKRPQKEVDSILNLLCQYLDECEKELKNKNIRFVFLGDKSAFSPEIRDKMINIEEMSSDGEYIVNLALNYGGRTELVIAFNRLMSEGKSSVTEEDIENALFTKDSPELDLVVRTGGDLRISNFLLWQSAYSEFYFTEKLWPDFTTQDVDAAVDSFTNRKRRFGGV